MNPSNQGSLTVETRKQSPRSCVFIQVRMTSTRVPGKALLLLGDTSVLDHVLVRSRAAGLPGDPVICTSSASVDGPLEAFAAERGVVAFRGSEENCLQRFWDCAVATGTDIIVRICGDSPLIDPSVIRGVVRTLIRNEADYAWTPNLPVGAYVEAFTAAALQRALIAAVDPAKSDDLTFFLRRDELNEIVEHGCPAELRRPEFVLALNRPEDLVVLSEIFDQAPRPDGDLQLVDAISYLADHPDLARKNADYVPKPTSCDTRLDVSRLPTRPPTLPWYAPLT